MKETCDKTARALSLLGLATRAGRVVVGVSLICTALSRGAKNKTPLLVLEAADSSANTHKRITDRTAFYGVPSVRLEIDCAALSHVVGKREALVAAVGVTEPNLAKAIMEALGVETL